MSLLLDALKKAEREQLRHATALYPQEPVTRKGQPQHAVPLLQHGIYVPRSAHDRVTAAEVDGSVDVAPAWEPDTLAGVQPDYVTIQVPGDGLWRFYLVLASMLVVLMTVGIYAYYRYLLLQYPASYPATMHVPDTTQVAPPKVVASEPVSAPNPEHVPPMRAAVAVSPKTSPATTTESAASGLIQTMPRFDVAQPSSDKASAGASQLALLPTSRDPLVIIKKDSDQIGALLTRAYQHYIQQNYDGAQVLYEEVVRVQETQRDALLGLAAIALHAGRVQDAIEHYRVLLRVNPVDDAAVAGLVSALQRDNPEQAQQVALQAVQRAPHSALVHFTLGTLYINMQRWQEAQLSLLQAVSLSRENADYQFNLGVVYDRLGDSGAAIRAYRQALQLAATTTVVGFRRSEAEKRIQQLAVAE